MPEIYQELADMVRKGERGVLATVVASRGSAPRKAGAKMLIKSDGAFIGTVGGGGVEQQVREKAGEVMGSGQPQMVHLDLSGKAEGMAMICGGQMDVFLEPVSSPESLLLFGAGHISQATAAIARMLGFRIIVIDPRPEYNNRERFPDAEALLVVDYENAFARLDVGENSYIVIYTTGHVTDEGCLRFALGTGARYIGMIGSQKKVREIRERLALKGVAAGQLDRTHAPIGLDIGAETPEEIAVSILAEIVKVRRTPAL